MNGEANTAKLEINEDAEAATAELAAEVLALNERREREAKDRAALTAAEAIVAARAELAAALAAVPLTEKPLKDAESEWQKCDAQVKRADQERAEIAQRTPAGLQIISRLRTAEKLEFHLAELTAEIAAATERRDFWSQKYIEAGAAAASAGGRVTKARAALAKAEAVLEGQG